MLKSGITTVINSSWKKFWSRNGTQEKGKLIER